MRARRAAVAAVVGLVAVVTAGCGSGDSGSTTMRLVPLSARPPQIGNCYLDLEQVSYPATDTPIDCARTHRAETAGAGTFTGAHADSPRPPALHSEAYRAAFADCDKQAQAYVGGDWRGGALALEVVVPDNGRWSTGTRWFRCDLTELLKVESLSARDERWNHSAQREGSLRGVIKAGGPPAHNCFHTDKQDQLSRVDCSKKHRFEYVGIWTAPNVTWDGLKTQSARVVGECRRVINTFLGLPKSSSAGLDSGVIYLMPSQYDWDKGDRGVRCFLWSDAKDLTRSLRGTHTGTS